MKDSLLYLLLVFSMVVALPLECLSQNHEGDAANDTISLKEVVVKASRPISEMDGEGMVTTVAGTVLQSLGSARDVLGYIPGVITSNGSVEVFGKGATLIYINGRKVLNAGDIDRLRSERIKSIKVITNPGARYDSSVGAIIRISTFREYGEGFALDTKTTLGYRDYLHGKETLWMNYRTGGLDVFGTLEYSNNRQKGHSRNEQNTWGQNPSGTYLSMKAKSRSQLYYGQAGFNYITADNHSFGMYYTMAHKPTKSDVDSRSSIFTANNPETSTSMSQHKSVRYNEHLVDGYYSGTWGDWSADITFDLLWKNNHEDQYGREISDRGEQLIDIYDRYTGRLLAGEINLGRKLWKGSVNLGVSYSNSRRAEEIFNPQQIIEDNDDHVAEDNAGVYAELNQTFGRLMMRAGLRYEHIDSRYYAYGVKRDDQSRRYDEVLPSLSFTFPVRRTMFQLGYTRSYNRPLYEQLSSTISYVNQNLYESGNPHLRSSYSENVSLNFRWNWLMVMAGYNYISDIIITEASAYEGNADITLLRKENSSRPLHRVQVMASVMPGFIKDVYYPVVSAGVVAQSYKMAYRGSVINMNRPMGIVRFNNIFKLPDNYMLRCDMSWRGRGDGENNAMSAVWQVNVSAQKVFDAHWDVKLSVNDVFNTARKNKFKIYSEAHDVVLSKYVRSRLFEVTVGYKFNVPKSKYKGKGAAESEKERL